MQSKFAADRADFGGADQARVGDGDRVERALELVLPEGEEFLQLGKLGPEVVVLAHVSLQQPAVVGSAVEDACGGQAVSFQLAAEIFRDHCLLRSFSPSVWSGNKRECVRAGSLPWHRRAREPFASPRVFGLPELTEGARRWRSSKFRGARKGAGTGARCWVPG